MYAVNDVNVKMYVSYIHFVFLWCSRRGNGQGYHVDLALYMLTHVLYSCGFPEATDGPLHRQFSLC